MEPQLVRKSAHGRTNLFLPQADVIMKEIKTMNGVTHETASVYHILPQLSAESGVCCWHCCEPIAPGDESVPIPKTYDRQDDIYYVYGITCSLACCKAYIIEHTTYDRNHHLTSFGRFTREAYGVRDVTEAPPRAALKRFGGPLDAGKSRCECKVVSPPLVSYCMLLEERNAQGPEDAMLEDTTIDEPLKPAMFTEFLSRRHGVPAPERPKRTRTPKAASGPMSKFAK